MDNLASPNLMELVAVGTFVLSFDKPDAYLACDVFNEVLVLVAVSFAGAIVVFVIVVRRCWRCWSVGSPFVEMPNMRPSLK